MPRKPLAGPPILRLERLSDGLDPRMVDDFTGQPIAQASARVPPDLHTTRTQRKVENALRVLHASGLVADTALPMREHKPFIRRL